MDNSLQRKIIVLHEYGAPEHYRALEAALSTANMEIEYREFRFFRAFLKGIFLRNFELIKKSISNLYWLSKCWVGFIKEGRIVIGIAPFDWRLLLLLPIINKNISYWHTSWPYWDGKRFPKPFRYKFVMSIWQYVITNKFKSIFFTTKYAQDNFKRKYIVNNSNVVYHSFDENIFYSRIRHTPKTIVVGFVGRLEKMKGIHIFLHLAKQDYSFPIKFVIAGSGSLQDLVKKESILSNGQIEYRGFLDSNKLADLYREIDFLLLPSLRQPDWEEAFGMVIIEAMACGAIPITTDHPGPVEILEDMKENVFEENNFREGFLNILVKATCDPKFIENQREQAIKCASEFNVKAISVRWHPVVSNNSTLSR